MPGQYQGRDLRLRRVSVALGDGLGRHALAGFEQRLEIAEDPRPAAAALLRIAAAGHHAGHQRRALGVMGDGHRADAQRCDNRRLLFSPTEIIAMARNSWSRMVPSPVRTPGQEQAQPLVRAPALP
jgi:hypothetical protein